MKKILITVAIMAILTPSASANLIKSDNNTCIMDDSTLRPKANCGEAIRNFPSKWGYWYDKVSPALQAYIDKFRAERADKEKLEKILAQAKRNRLNLILKAR